jgi:hypothetical protein
MNFVGPVHTRAQGNSPRKRIGRYDVRMGSRGPYAPYIRCPYCGSTAGSRVMLTLGNLGRLVIILLALLVTLALDSVEGVELCAGLCPLKRRCGSCRGKFFAESPPPKEPTCGECGYNLTGNVSGTCPECGWPLTRKVKRRVRLQARLEQRSARRRKRTDPQRKRTQEGRQERYTRPDGDGM